MWIGRHRRRHGTRLKNIVLQAVLNEVAGFLERANTPGSPDATLVRWGLAAIEQQMRIGGA